MYASCSELHREREFWPSGLSFVFFFAVFRLFSSVLGGTHKITEVKGGKMLSHLYPYGKATFLFAANV